MVQRFLRDMGMPADCNLHLEYKVKPPKGRGEASHTDLMVISGESSLAVEAKWTEPGYEKVSKWLKKGSNKLNRFDVFTGWLGLLQQHAQRILNVQDFSDTVYQMVHRAASTCAAGGNPKLAYLVFRPSAYSWTMDMQKICDNLNNLNNLWNLLGNPKEFPFYLIEVQLSLTAAFEAIEKLAKGKDATGEAVRDALCNEQLFKFPGYKLCTINGGLPDESH